MPMTPPHAPRSSTGLSAHARDLWRESLRYRLLADALAASSTGAPRPMPAAATDEDAWLASR